MSKESLQALFEALKTNRELRHSINQKYRKVQQGNWQALVNIAKESGYDFTVEELKAKLPQGFFKGHGKKARRGWDISTLKK
jgi:predicted ribosomally synthesized peptide with nif11-like leader